MLHYIPVDSEKHSMQFKAQIFSNIHRNSPQADKWKIEANLNISKSNYEKMYYREGN